MDVNYEQRKRFVTAFRCKCLYQLGIKVETARKDLRDLVNSGVPYESEEMQTALQKFRTLDSQWKSLEAQYLELRKEVTE